MLHGATAHLASTPHDRLRIDHPKAIRVVLRDLHPTRGQSTVDPPGGGAEAANALGPLTRGLRFRVPETGLRRALRIPNSRDTDGTRCVFQQGKDNGLDKGSNRVDLAVACIAPRANRRFVALRLAARQDCGASLNI